MNYITSLSLSFRILETLRKQYIPNVFSNLFYSDVIVQLVTQEDIARKNFLHVTPCLVKIKDCAWTLMKIIIAANASTHILEKIVKVCIYICDSVLQFLDKTRLNWCKPITLSKICTGCVLQFNRNILYSVP